MVTDCLLNVMMLVAEGLVLWLAYRVLRKGRVVPGMSQAEIRCLMGGFIVMCLTINLATHWGERMDTLRLFIPIWATLAWSWGVRLYFGGQPKAN
jgi:hypothetical protein